MLEKLYALREKYVNEVVAIDNEICELNKQRTLCVAKVQVVDDLIGENGETPSETDTETTQPHAENAVF